MLFEVGGGIALILFGIRFLRKSLDRLFGARLADHLENLTANRWRAFLGGAAIACIAPSSTTLALVTMNMLRTGRLSPERMLAVMLGANVGITVTVQMLALNIYSYYPVFLVTGLLAFQFLKRDIFRGIGQFLLSMGFIFLAMDIISRAAGAASGDPDLMGVIEILSRHPVLLTLLAAGLAMALQSSTAIIGLGLALAEGGLGGFMVVIAVVLGANLGIAGTAVISGWSELEERRTSLANLGMKVVPAAVILLTAPLWGAWLAAQDFGLVRFGANFHTGFNLVVAMIGLPLLGPVSRLMRFLIATDPQPVSVSALPSTYLDRQSLAIPSLALVHATRETLLMADVVKGMLGAYGTAQNQRNLALAHGVRQQDDRVDTMNGEIKRFLSQISEESLNPQESRALFSLLTAANELECIGDIVDKNLCDHLVKQLNGHFTAPTPDQDRLRILQEELSVRFSFAIGLMTTQDRRQTLQFLRGRSDFDQKCRAAQSEHFSRLVSADVATLEASAYFLDCVTSYRRINAHLTHLGQAFLSNGARS